MDAVTLGMAKAFASNRVFALDRDRPVPVATRAAPPFDSSTGLSAVDAKGTAKTQHKLVRTAHGIRLAFTGWQASSTTEADTPNSITVRAALEYPATQLFPVTFGGSRSVVIEPGATVLSDVLGVVLPKGTTFWTRTFVQPASGGKFPRESYITTSPGEGHNYDGAGTDLTGPGSASLTGIGGSQRVYGPAAILGQVVDPGKAVIGIVGDSIANGTGDNDIGYIQRALADNYSFQKVSFPGEGYFGWNTNFGISRYRRMGLLERCGITHLICEYGVNSLALTLADLKQAAIDTWTSLAYFRVPMYQPTLTPQTTSTDVWATTTNQALIYPAREPVRTSFNAWLRDGAPMSGTAAAPVGAAGAGVLRAGVTGHPLRGIIEAADRAETARDSGIWRAGYTSDGTHPNTAGATAIAAAINPVTLFGAASAS